MICPTCKSQNSSDSRFCISCGAVLSQVSENKKMCPNGHVYGASLSSCPYCPSPQLQSKILKGSDSSTETISSDKGKDATRIISPSGGGSSNFNKTVIVSPGDDSSGKATTSRKIIGWLVTFSWKEEGQDFRLYEGRNLISGDSKSDVALNDPSVSSPHCMILFRNGKLRIKDELSTNGTMLNGSEIEEAELNDGDVIKIGRTELKFRSI
ncbi:MAG: FHA domain-containing protein [Ignavibacteria bacterium]|nr:FHA domain-containing protein [Ignavibacteria bacterium]